MILGKNLILTVGDENRGLAASKSCQLSIDTDFIEVCSPVNGSWKDYLPTINSWSASVDMLVASLSDHKALLKKQDNKEKLMCCFFDTDLQEFYKGYVYIKGLQIKGTIGSLADMSVSLQPTGKLNWADEVEIDMSTGSVVQNKALRWNSLGEITILPTGVGINYKELTISNDTRITLQSSGVVLNASAADVETMLNNNDSTSINASAILSNPNTTPKSVVVKKQSNSYPVTILVSNSLADQPVITLSKF